MKKIKLSPDFIYEFHWCGLTITCLFHNVPGSQTFLLRIRIRPVVCFESGFESSHSNQDLAQNFKIINFIKLHYLKKNNFFISSTVYGKCEICVIVSNYLLYIILAWLKGSFVTNLFRIQIRNVFIGSGSATLLVQIHLQAFPGPTEEYFFIFRAWLDKRNEEFFRDKSANVEVNSTNVRDNFCIFRQLLEATAYLHSNGKRSKSVSVLGQTVSGIVYVRFFLMIE